MPRGDKAIKRLILITILLAASAFAGTISGQIQTATGGAVASGTLSFTLSQPSVLSGVGSIVTSSVACYTSTQGNVVGVPDPLALPLTSTNTASGTLTAGTYYVKVTYAGAGGESASSPEMTVVLSALGTINVNPPVLQPSSATGYKIYIGATSGSETLQGTVVGWTQFQQAAPLVVGTVPQASNTSSCSIAFSDQLVPTGTFYTVNLVNRNGSQIAGFPQTWCTYGGASGVINISNGAPTGNCGTNGVYYPTPILSSSFGNSPQSVSSPIAFPGGIVGDTTFSGNVSASSLGVRRVFADQQAGADFCAKLLVASQAANVSIVDASGFTSSQSCASSINLATSNVLYVFPPNLTVIPAAGVTITISGNDAYAIGSGDSTLFDFSTGSSANSNFVITGNRVTLRSFKVIGNRVALGTSSSVAFIGVDRPTAEKLTITNSGGGGITLTNSTNGLVQGNNVSSTGLTAIYVDGTGSKHRILDNTVTDGNLSNTGGHGAIMASGIAAQSDLTVSHNIVTETAVGANHVGIGINGITGVEVSLNKISANGSGGEGIAVTATKARITGNETSNSAACGILYYATPGFSTDFVISGNVSYSNTQGLCLVWGANSVTISDGSIFGNRLKGNSTYGLQTYNGAAFTGPAVKNLEIFGNSWLGNTSGTFNLLAVTGSYAVWGNTDVDNSNGFSIIQGLIANYNGTATVSNGIPSEYATIDLTAQTANIGNTPLYVVPASGAGLYRVSCYVILTGAGTTSTLPACNVLWTDKDNSVAQALGLTTTNGGNTTTTVATGSAVISVKASTTIQYSTTGYASTGTPMQYAIHIKLEAL